MVEAFPKSVNETDVEQMLRNAGWTITEMLSFEYMGRGEKARKKFTTLATTKPPGAWNLAIPGVESDVWTTGCKRVNEKEGMAAHNVLIRRIGVYGLPATEPAKKEPASEPASAMGKLLALSKAHKQAKEESTRTIATLRAQMPTLKRMQPNQEFDIDLSPEKQKPQGEEESEASAEYEKSPERKKAKAAAKPANKRR